MTLLQDRFHALGMSVHGSQVECGVPLSIMHVQSTTCQEQRARQQQARRIGQHSIQLSANGRTLPKDHLRDSNMAIATRSHQRCSSLFAATCVHIGTTGDQHFRHLHLSRSRRKCQPLSHPIQQTASVTTYPFAMSTLPPLSKNRCTACASPTHAARQTSTTPPKA
eukprot:scaffold4331_cov400-Prasinococcus_capsulatus_cf.AAC.5